MDNAAINLTRMDGTWTLEADGEVLFGTPDRHLALDLARALGEHLAAERGSEVAVAMNDGGGERVVARYGVRTRMRKTG